jgi:hypothetical protein
LIPERGGRVRRGAWSRRFIRAIQEPRSEGACKPSRRLRAIKLMIPEDHSRVGSASAEIDAASVARCATSAGSAPKRAESRATMLQGQRQVPRSGLPPEVYRTRNPCYARCDLTNETAPRRKHDKTKSAKSLRTRPSCHWLERLALSDLPSPGHLDLHWCFRSILRTANVTCPALSNMSASICSATAAINTM